MIFCPAGLMDRMDEMRGMPARNELNCLPMRIGMAI